MLNKTHAAAATGVGADDDGDLPGGGDDDARLIDQTTPIEGFLNQVNESY